MTIRLESQLDTQLDPQPNTQLDTQLNTQLDTQPKIRLEMLGYFCKELEIQQLDSHLIYYTLLCLYTCVLNMTFKPHFVF